MVNPASFVVTANPPDHNVLFERFLSVGRSSLPDIDVDMGSVRRHEWCISSRSPTGAAVPAEREEWAGKTACRTSVEPDFGIRTAPGTSRGGDLRNTARGASGLRSVRPATTVSPP
ncbi:hypothetical protein ACH4XT_01290 [Streptomyces avidinii]|uniref:hypothetical protein n=1 Tax=Streptomyces avidinii TaxID=1895 RepID=UPI00378D505A